MKTEKKNGIRHCSTTIYNLHFAKWSGSTWGGTFWGMGNEAWRPSGQHRIVTSHYWACGLEFMSLHSWGKNSQLFNCLMFNMLTYDQNPPCPPLAFCNRKKTYNVRQIFNTVTCCIWCNCENQSVFGLWKQPSDKRKEKKKDLWNLSVQAGNVFSCITLKICSK